MKYLSNNGKIAPLPVPHYMDKPMEIPSKGQGPGETQTPPGVQSYVRGLTKQVKPK